MSRTDTFRRVPWSFAHCCVAIGVIAIFRVAFHLLSLMGRGGAVFSAGAALWILLFGWMAIFPLWIARNQGMLQRPKVGRVLRELGLAVPLVLCLLLAEGLVAVILKNMPGGPVEIGSPYAPMRDAPNEPRLYLLLIPAFTIGPIAEELFFRGLLYNALRQRTAPPIAMGLQAVVFAFVHYHGPDTKVPYVFVVFALGVVMAGVYEWRKTLWSPIALHTLRNFASAGPIIALMILNSHTPARTWREAEQSPDWLGTGLTGIERKATGEEQRLYAINTWGSQGLHMWKQEIRALQAVCDWFPDDREACAKARAGIVWIYQAYLRDPRRAVVESDRILLEFKDEPEACAQALVTKGWAYYELGNYDQSRESFQDILDSYPGDGWALEAASEGLRALNSK